MISINSYIRRDANTFEPISLTQTAAANSAYIEGAIELSIDNTGIIGKEAWDYVDQLWSYIVDMATRLRCGQSASSYFPDQPLKLTFQKEPGGTSGSPLNPTAQAARRWHQSPSSTSSSKRQGESSSRNSLNSILRIVTVTWIPSGNSSRFSFTLYQIARPKMLQF